MSGWTTPAARKRHACDFCGEYIQPGERYEHIRVTPWDHPCNEGFSTWRAHAMCREGWDIIGPEWDYEFPDDPHYWRDMMEENFPGRWAEFPFDRECVECDGHGVTPEAGRCVKCHGTGSKYGKPATPDGQSPDATTADERDG